MDLLHSARRPPQWLRVALAGLLLAFVLDSMAHASHQHDAAGTPAGHAVLCGYCAAFTNAADAPAPAAGLALRPTPTLLAPAAQSTLYVTRRASSARPRAPPLS